MATYRFRLFDRHGQLIGVHYLWFDSDAEAIRYADTTVWEYDCGSVEVWQSDTPVSAAMQRSR
jgi:hypothetical protein